MTPEITTRRLTDEERARILSSHPRFGLVVIAIWAGMVPIVIAGIIGFTLALADVPTGWAVAVSYAAGLIFGLFGLRKHWRDFQGLRQRYLVRRERALASGEAERVKFSAAEAWEVLDDHDQPAGYVFDTGAEPCVFWGNPPHEEGADDRLPVGEVMLEIVPGLNWVPFQRAGRGSTPVSGALRLRDLGVDAWDEAGLLSRAALLHAIAVAQPEQQRSAD